MDVLIDGLCRDEEDKLVFSLIRYIREKNLKAGDKLPSIRAFATELGVSQSQVRSGVLRAASMGLIKILPRSGCYVADMGLSKIVGPFALLFEAMYMNDQPPLFHIYALKTTLERGIAKRVADIRTVEDLAEMKFILEKMSTVTEQADMIRLDEEYHAKLANASRNPLFFSLITAIHSILRPSRFRYKDFVSEFPQSLKEHTDLFEAIKDQDGQRAGDIAERHSNRRMKRLTQDY
jgi:GntR family transcriptional repressor for pyruvate dehydrogenase complex